MAAKQPGSISAPMTTRPPLEKTFTDAQLAAILDQSAIYNCACPAQLCQAINQQRHLFAYQASCLNQSATDAAVHRLIAETAQQNHQHLEQCLRAVLELEGWDMATLTMPANLGKRLIDDLTSGN
jgi:hypothetical protein